MRFVRLVALLAALAVVLCAFAKKKKKEEETQTLLLPKDPPVAVVAESRRLVFHVSPLSAKGLLSQQVRDALKALGRQAGNAQIVKLRAFVAGTGDMRRVRDIVSETFTEKKQNVPAVSTVQAGGLPLEGAQVVLESAAVSRKEINPGGIGFISAVGESSANPLDPVAPLFEKATARLATAVQAAGSGPEDVLLVTCYLSSLEGAQDYRIKLGTQYRSAALNLVQTQRAPARAVAACEAVTRLDKDPGKPMVLLNPESAPGTDGFSAIALVGAPRLVLSGSQSSYGYQEADARLAFQRLQKSLDGFQTSLQQAAFLHVYPLTPGIAAQVRKIRPEFARPGAAPAGTLIPMEGLPSMDSGFALDAVAIQEKE